MRDKSKWRVPMGILLAGLLLQAPGKALGASPAVCETCITSEGELKVYVAGAAGKQSWEILLGSEPCEAIPEERESIRTWILADNSNSISREDREQVRQELLQLLAEPGEGEQFRFSVFGEEAVRINEFSENYAALRITAEELPYEEKNSYVWRVLQQAIQELSQMDRSHCASRLLLITDGGEFSGGDATAQEVTEQLKRAGIPLYVLGCGQDPDALETLALAARTSGGAFLSAGALRSQEAGALREMLPDALLICRVAVPQELWDGASRWLQITADTEEGTCVLSRAVTLPQRAMPTATPVPPTATPRPTETPLPLALTEPPSRVGLAPEQLGHSVLAWMCGAAAAGALLAASLFLHRRRADRADPDSPEEQEDLGEMPLPESANAPEDPETQLLFGRTDEVCLLLTDAGNAKRSFFRRISGRVSFGTEPGRCDWILTGDASISRCHGCFSVRDQELWVEDLNSRNGIWVNRRRITAMTALRSGDLLRLGDSEFRVTLGEETS